VVMSNEKSPIDPGPGTGGAGADEPLYTTVDLYQSSSRVDELGPESRSGSAAKHVVISNDGSPIGPGPGEGSAGADVGGVVG
jgi:hypothetical protein